MPPQPKHWDSTRNFMEKSNTEINLSIVDDGKECVKCAYKRKITDNAPAWACPSCGVAYVKAEAAVREEQSQKEFQNRIERVEFMRAHEKADPKMEAKITADKSTARTIYILTFFGGITAGASLLVAIIMAHKNYKEVGQTTWVNTHFANQVSAFWWATLWSSIGLVITVIGFIASVKESFSGGLGRGYEVYGQIFGWIFSPLFLKSAGVGILMVVIASIWHLIKMIKGFRALNRNEEV